MNSNGRFHASPAQAEINVTPLIDVLLALVVILMIAAPLTMKKLSLPLAGGPSTAAPQSATLSILATGELFLQGQPVNRAQLGATLAAWGNSPQPPALEIRSDRDSRYENVADVLALAQSSGLSAIRIEDAPAR